MIVVSEHGGIFGGSGSIRGKQVVKVFTQIVEPVPLNVGDIWIQTDKDINNVIFRDLDPLSAVEGDAIVKIGNKPKVQVNAKGGLEFIGVESDVIIIDYFDLKPIQTHSPDYIKLWENKFMSIWTVVGAVKTWESIEEKWEHHQAYCWNGSAWFPISFNDYLIGIASPTGIKVLDSFGEVVSSYAISSNLGTSIVSTPEGKFLFSTRSSGDIYRMYEHDAKTKISTSLNSGYTIEDVCVDNEGNYYFVRYNQTSSGGYGVLKYNKDNKLVWFAPYERSGSPGIAVDSDSNIFHVGTGPDRLIRRDKDNNVVWRSSEIKVQGGDKCIALGSDRTIHTFMSGKLYKGDYNGSLIWEVEFGYTLSSPLTVDGSGCIYVKVGNNVMRKYDPEGNEMLTIDAAIPIASVSVDPSGYIYILGTTYLKKFDRKGVEIFTKDVGGNKIIAHPLVGAFPLVW